METLSKQQLIGIDKLLTLENKEILLIQLENCFNWTYRAIKYNKETHEYKVIGIVRSNTFYNLTTHKLFNKIIKENCKLDTYNHEYYILTDWK